MIYSIQDNFFKAPHTERALMLAEPSTSSDTSEWHGNDCTVDMEHSLFTLDKFSRLLPGYELQNNQKSYNWAIKNPKDAVHIHWDDDDVIGIVYLNEKYTDYDATLMLSHKKTGAMHRDQKDFGSTNTGDNLNSRLDNDEFNLSKWDTLCAVQCKWNRLLLFCPQYYHAASQTFGKDLATSRLVQVFHFKKEKL